RGWRSLWATRTPSTSPASPTGCTCSRRGCSSGKGRRRSSCATRRCWPPTWDEMEIRDTLYRLVQALYSGVLNGSVYGLMAIGLTLIWGSLRMLNLAHGALYIAGAYIAYGVLGTLGLPVPVPFAVAVGGAALLGLASRATSQDMDAAKLMGIPIVPAFVVVMVISAALAGLAGVLLGSILFFTPSGGFTPMLMAMVVTIFGGLGSVAGTIWAAYIIGLMESFVAVYVGPSWALPGIFLFIIAMLVIRPNGLFGLGEARR